MSGVSPARSEPKGARPALWPPCSRRAQERALGMTGWLRVCRFGLIATGARVYALRSVTGAASGLESSISAAGLSIASTTSIPLL